MRWRRSVAEGRHGLLSGVGLSLALALTPVGSGVAQDGASERTRITAAALESWGPQYSLDEEGRPSGFAIELFDAVAERAGLEVTYRVYPSFPQMTRALLAGEVDVIPNSGITETRSQELAFTRPIETFAIVLFVRRDQVEIRGLDDLGGRTVAVVRSNAAVPLVERRGEIRAAVYDDPRPALFDLLAGQVDALAYPQPVIEWMARSAGVDRRLRVAGAPLAEIKRGIALRLDDTALLEQLDAVVEELVGSPDYEAIYRRWYAEEHPFWTARRVGLGMGLLLIVTFLAMVAWRYYTVVRVNRRLVEAMEERERVEAELRQSQAKLGALFEQAQNGIVLARDDGQWVDVNPAVCRMLRRSREDLVGRYPWELSPESGGETAAEEIWREFLDVGEMRGEFPLVAADGEVVHTEYSAVANILPGLHLSIMTDVSEEKRAEAERAILERQLAQAQKMEAIGTLAGGIAHDFNNILTAILGYADLARKELPGESAADRYLSTIVDAGNRARDLVRQILSFSRHTEQSMEPTRIEPLIEEAVQMLRATLPATVDLRTDYEAPGAINADPVQIHQILINLCTNASQAVEESGGGLIEIRLDQVEVGAQDPGTVPPGLEPGRYQRLAVHDDGVGMDEETRQRIFEPFFTTKERGRGTGLGLSVVHGIIAAHGGAVTVDSEPGRGSTFEIYLPLLDPEVGLPPKPDLEVVTGGRERVMLVDDEEALLELGGRTLSDLGYQVDAFASPLEALDAVRSDPEAYDIVLTDIVMPEMSGDELTRRLHEIRPDFPVVLMTGFSERFLDEREVRRIGARRLVTKPMLVRDLARALREALDEGDPVAESPPPEA